MTARSSARAVQKGTTTRVDESATVAPIRAGDEEAFKRVFTASASSLYAFAYRLSGSSRALAQDVVQEAFLIAWRSGRTWNSEAGFRAYLFATVRSRVLMQHRHARVVSAWQETGPKPDAHV